VKRRGAAVPGDRTELTLRSWQAVLRPHKAFGSVGHALNELRPPAGVEPGGHQRLARAVLVWAAQEAAF
jgi:hypothetical protein